MVPAAIVPGSPAPSATEVEPLQMPQPAAPPAPIAVNTTPQVSQSAPTVIQLLDERLVIERRKRKVGEVVIRKEIETQIVEVPIHREKLIVEQVSPEYEQLAVVELGQPQVRELSLDETHPLPTTVSGHFTSVSAAIDFLQAIAAESGSAQPIQMRVEVTDATRHATYQRLMKQYSPDTV